MSNTFLNLKDIAIRHKYLLLALFILLIYLSPNIFFSNHARFLIHDNLDSNVVWYKNLAESGEMFGSNSAIISRSLGGLPRGCYPSEFNIMHLFYLVFTPLVAYNINVILMHLLAFVSMYVFAEKYFFEKKFKWAIILISLCFALLPFWPSGGAAITCQPLLLYAFLNIYNGNLNWKNWLIVFCIPFYSLFVLSNFFFLLVIFSIFLIVTIIQRKINYYFILAGLLFVLGSVICEHRLFEMQFIEHFESHRLDAKNFGTLNINGLIGVSIRHFFYGHYHFHSLHNPFILFLGLLAFVFCKEYNVRRNLLFFVFFAYLISVLLVLPDWIFLQNLMKNTKLIKSISLRFFSLYPLLWHTFFGYSCLVLLNLNKKIINKIVIVSMVLIVLFNMFSINDKDYFNSEFAENSFYRTYIDNKNYQYATFDEYYETELFSKIKSVFPPGNYYIACIGVDPETVQFNGYNTIDGYYYYQPRLYNKRMVEITKSEMEKSKMPILGNNHCVLISSELRNGKKEINDLSLNFDSLKK